MRWCGCRFVWDVNWGFYVVTLHGLCFMVELVLQFDDVVVIDDWRIKSGVHGSK
jgi:hypothetical protein